MDEEIQQKLARTRGSAVSIDDALKLVMEMIASQRLDYAAEILERIVDAVPDHADALNYLGILRFHLKGAEAAIEHLTYAASVAPKHAGIRNNLGNAHVDLGQIDAAVEHYRAAIELDPKLSDTYGNLASIMKSRRNNAEAERLLRTGLALNPKNGFAHHNLGNLLVSSGRAEEAIPHFWKASALIHDKSTTTPFLALAYVKAGMMDEAIKFVRKWAAASPGDPQAEHFLASFTGENIPARASDAYVAGLFDRFATSFDSKLDLLDYRAPELVGAAVGAFADGKGPTLVILDAGCGTGKCGKYLKRFAKKLVGVDLSRGMLAQAKKLDVYDTLKKAELTAFLQQKSKAYDLIVSADTLCYFGRLDEFAMASAKALRTHGGLIFTVEALEKDKAEDFLLAYNGRYAHSETYVRRVLEEAGFDMVRCDLDRLRVEGGDDVMGLVVTAQLRKLRS